MSQFLDLRFHVKYMISITIEFPIEIHEIANFLKIRQIQKLTHVIG